MNKQQIIKYPHKTNVQRTIVVNHFVQETSRKRKHRSNVVNKIQVIAQIVNVGRTIKLKRKFNKRQ